MEVQTWSLKPQYTVFREKRKISINKHVKLLTVFRFIVQPDEDTEATGRSVISRLITGELTLVNIKKMENANAKNYYIIRILPITAM
jgi:hypothetical protein